MIQTAKLLSENMPRDQAEYLAAMHKDGLPSLKDKPEILVSWLIGLGYEGSEEDLLRKLRASPMDPKTIVAALTGGRV